MSIISSKIFRSFILLLISFNVVAQEDTATIISKKTDNLYIAAAYHKGLLIPEYDFMTYMAKDYTQAVHISFYKQLTGNKDWQIAYNNPKIGFSVYYSTLSNDAVFGRSLAVYPFIRFQIFSYRKWQNYFQAGAGLNYVNKHFDLQDNYQNIAVGSSLNAYINFSLGLQYQLSDKYVLDFGIDFNHLSNASLQEPNVGLNFVNLFTGFNYLIGNRTAIKHQELPDYKKNNRILLSYSAGLKHTRSFQGYHYLVQSLSFVYKRNMDYRWALGLGVDAFYDSSVIVEEKSKNQPYHTIDNFKTGLNFNQELILGDFSFSLAEGIYVGLLDTYKKEYIYHKLEVRYFLNQHFFLKIYLKSHWNILDYMEWGGGYAF